MKLANETVLKLIRKFKYKRSLSERALKARERQSLHALSVEGYTMTGALSLTIGITFVFKFPNKYYKNANMFILIKYMHSNNSKTNISIKCNVYIIGVQGGV